MADFTDAVVAVIGEEASFGAHARISGAREVVLKICADHPTMEGAGLFAREQTSGITTMSVGTGINIATSVLPLTGIFAFLTPREEVTATVTIAGESWQVANDTGRTTEPVLPQPPEIANDPGALISVDLIRLAWARSGDKGGLFNVAVIARDPALLPWIAAAMTAESVGEWYAHLGRAGAPPKVDRFYVPGLSALNFVVHDALDGGILRGRGLDPAAKGMAQVIMRFPIPIPAALVARAVPEPTENLA
jgi:hypothetical protein